MNIEEIKPIEEIQNILGTAYNDTSTDWSEVVTIVQTYNSWVKIGINAFLFTAFLFCFWQWLYHRSNKVTKIKKIC